MDWLILGTLAALFIGIWHEINRFPAANKSILQLRERLDTVESDNKELYEQIARLDDEILSLSNEIDRIKDPEYYRALDEGDGGALYALDKARGNI